MKKLLVFVISLGLTASAAFGQAAKDEKQYKTSKSKETKQAEVNVPDVGERATDFELPVATKDTIFEEEKKLSEFLGKGPVVLAFYPADWSGGCTKEVCTLRDSFSEFEKLGAAVIGISGDYVYSHKQWAAHHNLPFYLASDHFGKVSTQFASYNPESGYSKRTVYVLDKTGVIRYKNLTFKAGSDEDYKALKEAVAAAK
ncbi:MAG TPA: redoxin domain-containing protein [candidate division Zixibacteria bacterium]|nr:redoxin domain-containing protein [candidate division Zixibacteria bacterium]